MDRVEFLDFTLLTRDIRRLDRYSTRQFVPAWGYDANSGTHPGNRIDVR